MDMHFDQLVEKVTNFIEHEANTETVIGKPFELGNFKCIPVIRVGIGFGSGGGEGEAGKQGHGEGGGAAAGMGVEPLGFLVAQGKETQFISTTTNKALSAPFEKVPDFIGKYLDQREKAQKEEKVAA